jgi:hypothetical protein
VDRQSTVITSIRTDQILFFGTPTQIRTENIHILPFEESDFTNLSIGALVQPVGIEPTSTALQAAAMTTSAKVALLGRSKRIELLISESQPEVLPLN